MAAHWTSKQRLFVSEYLKDGNAMQAAIRAGYAQTSAKKAASRILDIPHVAAAIKDGQARMAERVEFDADEIAKELLAIVRSDPRQCISPKPVDWPDDASKAVSKIKISKTGLEVTFHDRVKAAEVLLKMHGLLKEKHDHTHSGPMKDGEPGAIEVKAGISDDTIAVLKKKFLGIETEG